MEHLNPESHVVCVRCAALEATVKMLRDQVSTLQEKLFLWERHPKIAQGIKGESLVVQLTNLPPSSRNASFDIGNDTIKIEVKFSGLYANESGGSVFRWHWAKVFGQSGKKTYDRLLLVGRKDAQFSSNYLDANSHYIFFDVPYPEVSALATSGGNAGSSIRLSSNPATSRGKSSHLFNRYQVTEAELVARYGV